VKYLVDASVLSEPTKPAPDPRVVDWLRIHKPDIAIDPVIFGELRFGILILPHGKKAMALELWFDRGVGRLRKTGKAMPIKDSFIAATRWSTVWRSSRETRSISPRLVSGLLIHSLL